jgi:hypothetical protein
MLARAHLSLEDQRPTVDVTILIEIGDIRPHVTDLLRTGLSRDWTVCTLVGGYRNARKVPVRPVGSSESRGPVGEGRDTARPQLDGKNA